MHQDALLRPDFGVSALDFCPDPFFCRAMMVFLTKLAGVLAIFGFFFDVCQVAKGSDHFPLLATSAVINGGTYMTLIAAALGTLVEDRLALREAFRRN